MRHRKANKKLGRNSAQRQALFKGLIRSLIAHEEIKTTESKAKAVRRIFEKLVTKGKEGTLHTRRLIHAFLQDRKAVNKLVDGLAPKFQKRKGGFTRIIRLGERRGDRAMMVKLELVEKTEREEAKKKAHAKAGKGKEEKKGKKVKESKVSKRKTS